MFHYRFVVSCFPTTRITQKHAQSSPTTDSSLRVMFTMSPEELISSPQFLSRPSMIPLGDLFPIGQSRLWFYSESAELVKQEQRGTTGERLSATLTSNALRSARELQGSEQTPNEVQADGCARKSETGASERQDWPDPLLFVCERFIQTNKEGQRCLNHACCSVEDASSTVTIA